MGYTEQHDGQLSHKNDASELAECYKQAGHTMDQTNFFAIILKSNI
jgi:hypothetical protein